LSSKQSRADAVKNLTARTYFDFMLFGLPGKQCTIAMILEKLIPNQYGMKVEYS
jgi:hypothetical protein